MKSSRRRRSKQASLGQTLTEYALLAALFAVPLSAYFFPRLLKTVYAIFRTLAIDLTGPGI